MDELSYIQNQINQNNSWSAEQAQKQMDFQERMSNTAHQREIADLKASGLNPILSAKLGGASTPSGAMADVDQTGTSAFANILSKMLEIQADNAKANLINASSGYSLGDVAINEGNSATSVSANDVSTGLGFLKLFGLDVPNNVADGAASFINGATGADNGKNKSTWLYHRGQEWNSEPVVDPVKTIKDYNNSIAWANETGNIIKTAVSNVVNNVKNTVSKIIGKSSPSKKSLTSAKSRIK